MSEQERAVVDGALANAAHLDVRNQIARRKTELSVSEHDFLNVLFEDIDKAVRPVAVKLRQDEIEPVFNRDIYITTVSTSLFYDPSQDPEASAYRRSSDASDTKRPFSHFKLVKFKDDAVLFNTSSDFSLTEFKDFHKKALLTAAESTFALSNRDSQKAARFNNAYKSGFIIVLPEFSFPFPLQEGERVKHIRDIYESTKQEDKDKWESSYIVNGTFHDHDSYRNLAVLDWPFVPKHHSSFEHLLRFNSEQQRLPKLRLKHARQQTYHPKQTAAESIGEKLKPREGINWTYYDTPIGLVCVLICIDAFDARMLLRLIRWRLDRKGSKKIACIIVPTFSLNDKIREKCKKISEWMSCMVIYVNTQWKVYGRDRKRVLKNRKPHPLSHGLFICGKDINRKAEQAEELGNLVRVRPGKKHVVNEDKDLWFYTQTWHIHLDAVIDYASQCGEDSSFLRGIFYDGADGAVD